MWTPVDGWYEACGHTDSCKWPVNPTPSLRKREGKGLLVLILSLQRQVIISKGSKALVSVYVDLASPAIPVDGIFSNNTLLSQLPAPWQLTQHVKPITSFYNLLPDPERCLRDSEALQGTA